MIVVVGGGGGLSPSKAVIHVNAPTGSVVEFAKGGVTVKTLAADKGIANVDGKTADYYYSINSSNYGSWTVTASKDGASANETVAVSSNKQYDVALSYRVPAAYQAVEYIQVDANGYIDTGIIPITATIQIETNVIVATTGSGVLFGVEGGYAAEHVGGYDQIRFYYNNGNTGGIAIAGIRTIGTEYHILFNAEGGKVLINGAEYGGSHTYKALSDRQYSILVSCKRYGASPRDYGRWRYKDFIITDRSDNTILADYRPCYRKSDSVSGMWDEVSKTFKVFTNSTSVGPDLN